MKQSEISFKDVAGMDRVKIELEEVTLLDACACGGREGGRGISTDLIVGSWLVSPLHSFMLWPAGGGHL